MSHFFCSLHHVFHSIVFLSSNVRIYVKIGKMNKIRRCTQGLVRDSKKVVGLIPGMWPFCLEFTRSLCVTWVLQVLQDQV